MILLILKASSSLQDSHEAIWPNADQNFRGKIVLQFISNNTRLFSGLCRSSTECKSNTDPDNILYTATLSTGPTTTSFIVWRLRQQVFIQGKGRSNVEINAKENARVGQAVLPSHPLSTMSTVVSVSVMDGKLSQISVLPKTRLIKLPTYPDGASLDGSKAR